MGIEIIYVKKLRDILYKKLKKIKKDVMAAVRSYEEHPFTRMLTSKIVNDKPSRDMLEILFSRKGYRVILKRCIDNSCTCWLSDPDRCMSVRGRICFLYTLICVLLKLSIYRVLPMTRNKINIMSKNN